MTTIKINQNNIEPATIKIIAGSLKRGQVLVLPTDTIYGLSCLADNAAAIKKIRRLKKRTVAKPFLILVSDFKMLKKYLAVSKEQEAYLHRIWAENPRPISVVLKNKGNLPKELSGLAAGLAVRLPKSIFLIKIIKTVGRPLVSTSFNLSGEPALKSLKNIDHYFFREKPDLVVDAGFCRRGRSSRLIDLTAGGAPIILRK